MKKTINFGIDLGTTNSLIGQFNAGKIEIFKNPRGHKEGLPSIIGFRKDKIFIGDKARDYIQKDAKNVVDRFKRKMGTTETFRIDTIDSSMTPVELSSIILKELKSFVYSEQTVNAAVITIPASFDTIQSNATKKAGNLAGIDEVVLLQEPIAASLAYANKDDSEDLKNSQWIVYDLGGGTFDVALVKIIEGELTVVDHDGDNYFGGTDFDAMIVEKLIVPELELLGEFGDLLGEMKSSTGRYEKDWYKLLHAAEEAKIELSSDKSTEIEYEMEDDNGDEIELILTITRSQFEKVIKKRLAKTGKMIKSILTRQSLQPKDLKFVLMVGGSTFIPFIRQHIEELMSIPVNTNIDPINAIVAGATWYAGSKQRQVEVDDKSQHQITVRCNYERNTHELEEMLSAKVEGGVEGMTYRIHSLDGSFDSNIKPLKNRIMEDLPLNKKEFNIFEFKIMDIKGNVMNHECEKIEINQGRYGVVGQILPDELSLVTDIVGKNDTMLVRIFDKNVLLPTITKKTVEVGRNVIKGSGDKLKIIIVEGPSSAHYYSNKPIGTLEIMGKNIDRDLFRGAEIDLTFEMSESRDLTISAYLNGTGQEFFQIFTPKDRHVSPIELKAQIFELEEKIIVEQDEALENSNHKMKAGLEKARKQAQVLTAKVSNVSDTSITDEKFQLEDKKRALAAEVFKLTVSKRADSARTAYQEAKKRATELVQEHGNDNERHRLHEVTAREEIFLNSDNPDKIGLARDELESLNFQILMRVPDFLIYQFGELVENRLMLNDQEQAKILIQNGNSLIENESWDELSRVIARLWGLMPDTERYTSNGRMFTGIVSG
jgi:molecular chaperone DnaK